MVTSNRRLMCAGLCVSVIVSAAVAQHVKSRVAKPVPKPHFDQAYFNGHPVTLHTPPLDKGERVLVVGPWNLGPRVSPKPNDKRPNIYFVVPGTQHQTEGRPEFNHNEILSLAQDETREFDVYWAVVLDPNLREDFTSEQQLIAERQKRFIPGEDFSFEQIPSAPFLKELTKISSLDDLKQFRRRDGSLPRMAIITAGFAVRFSVENPEAKQATSAPTTH